MRNPFKQLYRRYVLIPLYHKRRARISFHHDARRSAWDQELDWRAEHGVPLDEVRHA